MNIMQYRAIKAQEAGQASATPAPSATPVDTQVKPQPTPIETPVKEIPATPVVPEKITIDGVGEVTIDELKNGYLRQEDYTKKTQDVSKQRKEAEEAISFYQSIKQNPQAIEKIKEVTPIPATLDPTTELIINLQNEVFDMKLEKEISDLIIKYPDFEIREVLKTAQAENTTNLENAYILNKSKKAQSIQPVDVEKIRQEERAKVLAEMEKERNDTQTIIASNNGASIVTDNQPVLSEAEKKVAKNMFKNVSDPYAEYAKWRNPSIKK